MHASRIVRLRHEDQSSPRTSIVSRTVIDPTSGDNSGDSGQAAEAQQQEPTPPITPLEGLQSGDALRWFGVLVPAELRHCQQSFAAALDSPAVDAVGAARGMRLVEVEIRKLRKEIRRAERVVG